MTTIVENQTRLIASPRNWIDAEALRQFCQASHLDGIRQAVGLPDLHAGKSHPTGAAFVTEGVLYPQLTGKDIGCGIGLWKTGLHPRDVQLDNWAKRSFDLELPWEGDVAARLAAAHLPHTSFDHLFGTLGGGNHFAELQAVDKVHKAAPFADLGLTRGQLVLLVHSGSRGLGESILNEFEQEHDDAGVPAYSPAAGQYLESHDLAVSWAKANRALLAQRFLQTLGVTGELILDACHNSLTSQELGGDPVWLHRKGAAPADEGPIVIPGSRGSLSYLVLPTGDGAEHAWSLAHGAGRKWPRSESRLRVRERFDPVELTETALGSRVICANRDLLYEEAPMAYKNIEVVIADLVDAGLISVIATLRPVLTYKTRLPKWPAA
jgi:release factor H-coupled RctB family protein